MPVPLDPPIIISRGPSWDGAAPYLSVSATSASGDRPRLQRVSSGGTVPSSQRVSGSGGQRVSGGGGSGQRISGSGGIGVLRISGGGGVQRTSANRTSANRISSGRISSGRISSNSESPVVGSPTGRSSSARAPPSPQLPKLEAYDEKVDIWAMGVLVFELLVGRTPFEVSESLQLGGERTSPQLGGLVHFFHQRAAWKLLKETASAVPPLHLSSQLISDKHLMSAYSLQPTDL
jgi:hypothetical protein